MKLRRALPVSALTTFALAVAAPASAETVGQTSGTDVGCPAFLTMVQHTTYPSPGYETTVAGVVTSFSHQANAAAGQVRLLMFSRTPSTSVWTLAGKSALQTVTTGQLNTFPTRIPVPAGTVIGSQLSSASMSCTVQATSSFDELKAGAYDPDSSSTLTTTGTYTGRLNISAVVEPDADGDGFGDVTQDLCPTKATTQAACAAAAPDTAITKAPKTKSTKRKSKITFTSSVPGSTFTCAVDAKKAKPCTSPFKKRLKYGKHKVVITAIAPGGLADPTPASATFKIKRPVSRG